MNLPTPLPEALKNAATWLAPTDRECRPPNRVYIIGGDRSFVKAQELLLELLQESLRGSVDAKVIVCCHSAPVSSSAPLPEMPSPRTENPWSTVDYVGRHCFDGCGPRRELNK